jgi:hypothetical protein
VPLDVLEAQINEWIAAEQARPAATATASDPA